MSELVVRSKDVRTVTVAALGLNVLLDDDLARLYIVETKALMQLDAAKLEQIPFRGARLAPRVRA